MKEIDRGEVNRALAKAIAYKQCGKQAQAEEWAAKLVLLLECSGILMNAAIWRAAIGGQK